MGDRVSERLKDNNWRNQKEEEEEEGNYDTLAVCWLNELY